MRIDRKLQDNYKVYYIIGSILFHITYSFIIVYHNIKSIFFKLDLHLN